MSAQSPSPCVRTTLVHRSARGPQPWWHGGVVCDFTGAISEAGLADVEGFLFGLARAGFDAISLRPADSGLLWDGRRLGEVIGAAHDVGMKVIVRVPGASLPNVAGIVVDLEDGVTTLVGRVRAALQAGADGVDLDVIDTTRALADELGPVKVARMTHRFTTLIRSLEAEMAVLDEGAILGAQTVSAEEGDFRRHLEEEWFHHLRDSALLACPWDAQALRGAVTRSLALRDPLGHVAAWSWSFTRRTEDGEVVDLEGVVPGAWEDGASSRRREAMGVWALSLPGAAYLPFGHLGGRLSREGEEWRRTWASSPRMREEADMVTRALRIREERGLASGSLAWVEGLEWARPGVGVHLSAGMMVVLNTGDGPVTVPAEHVALLRSDSGECVPGRATVVEPETCVWFETARVRRPPAPVSD